MKNVIIGRNTLPAKSVHVNLLVEPRESSVEIIFTDRNNNTVKEIHSKEAFFDELQYLITLGELEKAKKTVMNIKTSKGIKKTNAYNFSTSSSREKTSIRVVPNIKGASVKDYIFLEGITENIRHVELVKRNNAIKELLPAGAVVLVAVTLFGIAVEEEETNKKYDELTEYRNNLELQDKDLNIFGENWSNEVRVAYEENLKDNNDSEIELVASDKFWNGDELTSIKEKRALLRQWRELSNDYEDAKEEVVKKLGN